MSVTKSLLEMLQQRFPDSSNTTLRSWIKQGRVTVDGVIAVKADQKIDESAKIQLVPHRPLLPEELVILYQDADIVVVEKPEGLLSVATHFQKEKTAHAILKDYFRPKRVDVVHRLDQDTSGVMVFSLSARATEVLKDMFEEHALDRLYIAIVEGQLLSSSGTWSSHLVEDSAYHVHSSHDPLVGKKAITHFKCICSNRHYSWLELTLETGRKNQIRVHCQEAGHPVVGDKKYGAKTAPIKRLALHAYRLAFAHPTNGRRMVFHAPIPSSFFSLVDPGKNYAPQ